MNETKEIFMKVPYYNIKWVFDEKTEYRIFSLFRAFLIPLEKNNCEYVSNSLKVEVKDTLTGELITKFDGKTVYPYFQGSNGKKWDQLEATFTIDVDTSKGYKLCNVKPLYEDFDLALKEIEVSSFEEVIKHFKFKISSYQCDIDILNRFKATQSSVRDLKR